MEISGQFVRGSAQEGVRAGLRGIGGGQGLPGAPPHGSKLMSAPALLQEPQPGPKETLGGFSLSCVTFSDPPLAGSGKADSEGFFHLKIEAKNVSVGCFVQDPEGKLVGDLLLVQDSRAPSGQFNLTGSASFGSDTDLGDVWVDAEVGVALAQQPSHSTKSEQEPWDFTGTWEAVQCLDPVQNVPCSGQSLRLYSVVTRTLSSAYIHRISGTDAATGKLRYLAGAWYSRMDFETCGSTEGLSREKTKTKYGIELDSDVNTAPFKFLDWPPGPTSWDPNDTCLSDYPDGTPRKCASVPDPGLRDLCYSTCTTHANRFNPGEGRCFQNYGVDLAYIADYIETLATEKEIPYDRSKFIGLYSLPKNSVLSAISALSDRPEITYSDPNTASTAFFLAGGSYKLDRVADGYRSCLYAVPVKLSVTRLSAETADVTASANFSWLGKAGDPGYDWCVQNVRIVPFTTIPIALVQGVQLRVRVRASP